VTVLNQIYEEDFLGFSYGFRPGRRQHDALDALWVGIMRRKVKCAIVEIEEVRCDMNADFTEHLADSERFDEGHFWKQRRAFEKKWRDPDDVYIEVERREEERKKLGLPSRVIGSILPHSAVAQAEERWEAEQERKKKHPRKHRK
jgi:hypothetical protein